MNLKQFHLVRRPFRPTPDTSLYFPAESAELALARLRSAHADDAGLAVLDGEPGVGKTLVAMRFLEQLPADTPRLFLPMSRFARPAELYQAILFDWAAPYQGFSEHELRLAVIERLLGSLESGSPTVMVLDEAHHLTADILEDLRLLGNLETRTAKGVFVVLVGQPGLTTRLDKPELAAFSQRIAARCRLTPLADGESAAFLTHQIRVCGGDADDLLSDEASQVLVDGCRGVARLLNQAASLSLVLAEQAGESTVDAEAAVEALRYLGLADGPTAPADEIPARPTAARTPVAKRKPAKRRTA